MAHEQWMAGLPDRVKDTPFNCIAIPGSHESAAYNFEPSLGIAVEEPWFIRHFGTKSIVSNWAKTQHWSLGKQLTAGIRYFDFRVAHYQRTNEFRFVHGLYGQLVPQALNEIKTFLDKNSKEVVVLDFNHFYNMEEQNHETLLQEIGTTFDGKLIQMDTHNEKLTFTLNELWEGKGRVIIFYHNSIVMNNRQIWNGNLISSPWANTDDPNALITFLDRNYQRNNVEAGNMYVWQGVETPSNADVALNFWKKLEDYLASEATKKFVNWLEEKHPGPEGINICAADFVDQHEYISTVIGLNDTNQ